MREPLIYVPAWIWIIFVAAAAVSVFSLFCAARRERRELRNQLLAAMQRHYTFEVGFLLNEFPNATPFSVRRMVVKLCESGYLVCKPIEDRVYRDRPSAMPQWNDVDSFEYCVASHPALVST